MLCSFASLDNHFSFGFFDDLYKNIFHFTHLFVFLSVCILDTVRLEQIDGNRMHGILIRITAKLLVKCALIAVHTFKSKIKCNVNDPYFFVSQPERGFG